MSEKYFHRDEKLLGKIKQTGKLDISWRRKSGQITTMTDSFISVQETISIHVGICRKKNEKRTKPEEGTPHRLWNE